MAIASGSSIEAVLTLNASQFNEGLNSSLQAVEKFKASFGKSVTPMANDLNRLKSSLRMLETSLDSATQIISRFNVSAKGLSQFSTYATSVNKLANALKILSSDSISAEQSMNIINNMFKYFQNTLNGTEIKVKGVSNSIKELTNSDRQNVSSANQDTTATQQLANAQNQLQAEERETSGAVNQATNSMNRQATASKGLGKAMSSLRMMGSMVGSMIAYNFVHNLAMATTETINAKSEMNGYFQMLGYTKSQVADFNAELDKTVSLFPRLNKYALGETISSIGVEFELTTEEMKKAMPVVSMITSEYLRAGRNVNEASLAVKDILQGEFQRLSRETGVKAEQLKEAGWSGDKNDVMGLLEALDKVGKSRNWDTFVTKANSLNDAVLILQNRFSEWSADMVERVQPSIVHAFNTIMTVASNVSSVLNGALDWLSGDGLGQSIVKWGGLATAIIGVGTALIHLRTGANLTQIAQMGLTRSIGATVLGLEAETVAEYGTRTAIVSRITGIEAETVAETGRLNSILAVVSGLEAEEVAEIGKTKTLFASLLGLDMATLKEHGFSVALAEATTQMEAQTLASMSLAERIALIGATTIPAIAVVGAFAVAFGKLALDTMEATNRMSNFYDIQQHGKEYVDEAKDSVNNLKDKIKELKDTQSKYTKGSKEYENVGKAIDDLNGKMELANQNVKDNYEAWQRVNSAQENYDTTKQELRLGLQQKINQSLIDTGLSEKEANELSNNYLNEAIDGSRQLYEALQSVSLQYSKQAGGVAKLTEYWQNKGLTPEEIKLKVDPYIDSQNAIADDIEKMKLSTDLVEVVSTWGKLQIDQIQLTLKENLPKIEAGDWEGGISGMLKGLAHGLADLPVFGDFWDWVFKQFNIKETYGGKGWAGLDQFFTDASNNLKKLIMDMFLDLFNPDNLLDSSFDPVEQMGKLFADACVGITDAFNDFLSFDWLNLGDGGGTGGGITKKINIGGLLKGLFGDVDMSSITDFINNSIITPLSTAWNNFISDPLGSLNLGDFNIGHLVSLLLGGGGNSEDPEAIDPMATWVNNNIITPLTTAWSNFISDPVSFIGNMGFSVTGLLDSLLGTDIFTNIWTWTYTNIVSPIGNALWSGIQQIPIVGDILTLLGLLSDENIGASQKGRAIANWIGNGITTVIGQIPIIGDIARMLGLIPQTEPDAKGKGKGVGDSIKDGVMNGLNNLGSQVVQEFQDALNGIGKLGEQAFNTAKGWADQLWQGVNSILQRASPGFFHDQFQLEFGQDIPNAINEAGSTAYTVAQQYGQSIKDGISETSFNTVGFDSAVGVYQDDAQIVADSSQYMGVTTSTAFNDMTLAVNQTTSTMSGNVATTYNSMQQKQQTSLNSMKTQNLQAYNEMYLKSNQSLIQMRDSTSNVTHQMINAWDHMKNQIIASANRLKSDSTAHFNQLSSTIGSFYRKIQNPSNWGAGTGGTPTRSARHPTQGRSIARMMTRTATHHGAGASPYTNGTGRTMTLRALKNLICPSGDCSIFDGYDLNQKVNIDEFLSGIDGEHGFGWGDWSGKHYNHIKTTSDKWSMKSPTINLAGGIPTNADYKVGDFENGTPKISFGAFQSMAESIFSVIPYKFYYDSNWKGSWLGALQAGACNCSDGAEALIAFAEACGFSGYKQHTTTKGGIGHFYAVINGKAMDTTHFQNSGSWTPLGGAGIPTRSATPSAGVYPQGNKTVNVNVEISGTVYGVDDLDSKIQESVKQGLREEFNDPYTVAI